MHYINSIPLSLPLTLQELWDTLVHANKMPTFHGCSFEWSRISAIIIIIVVIITPQN